MTDGLTIITARREQISKEIADHELAISALQNELSELVTAERVFLRLTAATGKSAVVAKVVPASTPITSDEPASTQSRKPEGTPTTPDMIMEVLRDFRDHGITLVTTQDIKNEIANRWWPSVSFNEINPIAWRMAKRGQIAKDGTRYGLAPENAADLLGVTPSFDGNPHKTNKGPVE